MENKFIEDSLENQFGKEDFFSLTLEQVYGRMEFIEQTLEELEREGKLSDGGLRKIFDDLESEYEDLLSLERELVDEDGNEIETEN